MSTFYVVPVLFEWQRLLLCKDIPLHIRDQKRIQEQVAWTAQAPPALHNTLNKVVQQIQEWEPPFQVYSDRDFI